MGKESNLQELDENLKYYQAANDKTKAYYAFRILDILYNFKDKTKNKITDEEISEMLHGGNVVRQRRFINNLRNRFLYDYQLKINGCPLENSIDSIIQELIDNRDVRDKKNLVPINVTLIQAQIDLIQQSVEFIIGENGLMSNFGISYSTYEQDIYEELSTHIKNEIENYKKSKEGYETSTSLNSNKLEKTLESFKSRRNKLIHEVPSKGNQKDFERVLKNIDKDINKLYDARKPKSETKKVADETSKIEKSSSETSAVITTKSDGDQGQEKKEAEVKGNDGQELNALEEATENANFRILTGDTYADDELDFTISQSIDKSKTKFISTAISDISDDLKIALGRFARKSNKEQLVVPIHVAGVHYAGLFIKKIPVKDPENKEDDVTQYKYVVIYTDPLGKDSLPANVSNIIEEVFGIKKEQIITTTNVIQASESFGPIDQDINVARNNHCGAYVSFVLSGLENGTMQVVGSRIKFNIAQVIDEQNYVDIPDLRVESSNDLGESIRNYHSKLLSGWNIDPNKDPTNVLKKIVRDETIRANKLEAIKVKDAEEKKQSLQYSAIRIDKSIAGLNELFADVVVAILEHHRVSLKTKLALLHEKSPELRDEVLLMDEIQSNPSLYIEHFQKLEKHYLKKINEIIATSVRENKLPNQDTKDTIKRLDVKKQTAMMIANTLTELVAISMKSQQIVHDIHMDQNALSKSDTPEQDHTEPQKSESKTASIAKDDVSQEKQAQAQELPIDNSESQVTLHLTEQSPSQTEKHESKNPSPDPHSSQATKVDDHDNPEGHSID